MKNRNLDHRDDWATPPQLLQQLNNEFNFNFDPCPYMHNINDWDGLKIDWKERNFINPPYRRKLKELFVKKAIEESKKGRLCVMLIPVSTSTLLFHEHILPNSSDIRFLRGRVKFIGINSKDEAVNWHLWDRIPPIGMPLVKNSGMHDSMIVIFDGRGEEI